LLPNWTATARSVEIGMRELKSPSGTSVQVRRVDGQTDLFLFERHSVMLVRNRVSEDLSFDEHRKTTEARTDLHEVYTGDQYRKQIFISFLEYE